MQPLQNRVSHAETTWQLRDLSYKKQLSQGVFPDPAALQAL